MSEQDYGRIIGDFNILPQKPSKTFICDVSILTTIQKPSKIYTQKLHFRYKKRGPGDQSQPFYVITICKCMRSSDLGK